MSPQFTAALAMFVINAGARFMARHWASGVVISPSLTAEWLWAVGKLWNLIILAP